MPELPEVETTCRGLKPYLVGKRVRAVLVRDARLRWPVPAELALELPGQIITAVTRRAKYILFKTAQHCAILHLGMSGRLRLLRTQETPGKHDHVDIVFEDGLIVRLNDPRRFGTLLWTPSDPLQHKLLRTLGPEPLTRAFTAERLFAAAQGRRVAVKNFIMNAHIVVGVGNIYANEALFRAGIRPTTPAGRVRLPAYTRLVQAIKQVLREALKCGGTTLRDFLDSSGKPGYFALKLRVYGKAGVPCSVCGEPIQHLRLGQRSSFFCKRCQY